jgi:hypothetical protein
VAARNSQFSKTMSSPDEAYPIVSGQAERAVIEQSLWKWNLGMAIFHGIQALLVLILGVSVDSLSSFKLPMNTVFTNWTLGYPVAEIQERGLFPFVPMTSSFAWLSALAHLVVLIKFDRYISDLRRGRNLFRWYEYSVSSSVLIALIAQLFGMYDVNSLVLLMAVNACMNLFGLLMETMNEGKAVADVDWTPFWFGSVAGLVTWIIVFVYLAASGEAPGFVYGILVSYLIFFNTFPINMYLQYTKKGRWGDDHWGFEGAGYLFGERMYQIQSLVSKSMLLWLVVGGANQPNSYVQPANFTTSSL